MISPAMLRFFKKLLSDEATERQQVEDCSDCIYLADTFKLVIVNIDIYLN
jgi:hypothetical protein